MLGLLDSMKISKREKEPAPPQDLPLSAAPSTFRLARIAGQRHQEASNTPDHTKRTSPRSSGASGSCVFSSQPSTEGPTLPHDYAVTFMELVPVAICALDLHGNIRHMNPTFKSQINLQASSGPYSKSKCITSIVEVISLSDTDRFYSHLTELK